MTIWIMPEFNREGEQSACYVPKAANTMKLPKTRNLACSSPHGEPTNLPPPFPKKGEKWG